jgi:adenine-specific DNA-methyltransferase
MASLFKKTSGAIELLDAGAGTGALTAAFINSCCTEEKSPESIKSTAYEVNPVLLPFLRQMLDHCGDSCVDAGITFESDIREDDFILARKNIIEKTLFTLHRKQPHFSHAILNPPYKKMRSDGEHRLLLRSIGIEAGNLYSALVAISFDDTPR